jgi:ubiquinone/menaquinone biosynthesis C-methylase UbiE
MTTARPVDELLIDLLEHLGIAQAHFAARDRPDWLALATNHSDRITSLSLVCPLSLVAGDLLPLAARLLVVTGDQGQHDERIQGALGGLQAATSVTLLGYAGMLWSDVVADRAEEIGNSLIGFLDRVEQHQPIPAVRLPEIEGDVAGISYRIRGAGPPLVLLPLALAPSQWEPLIARLSTRCCTITLSGAALGIVAVLEARARFGYLNVVRSLLDAVQIKPGECVLEVGCGSGVVIREAARRSSGANRFVALDINPYLLREAAGLARQAGLTTDSIEFQQGNAEALPLPSNSVDVAVSCTVQEEGDADSMLAELVRVTKPGGRIGVIVRSSDIPPWVNLSASAALKSKVNRPGLIASGASPNGCADASLYQRFRAAGLTRPRYFPQFIFATSEFPHFALYRQQIEASLTAEEMAEWQPAVRQGEVDESFFIALPLHCAVGTKPQ